MTKVGYSVVDIANWFLSQSSMTHKKLQKLCYYSQAWYLALYNKRLFEDNFQAWVHGPVCTNLYQIYRDYYWVDIPSKKLIKKFDDKIILFLKKIFKTYGFYNEFELESLTHSEDPWKKARGTLDSAKPSTEIINDDDMKVFYQKQYGENQND